MNKKYTSKLDKNKGVWHNRVLIAVPCTGLVRMEWVMARYGQIVPTNWSQVEMIQWINSYVPLQYLLPDAENLIAKEMVAKKFEWLLSIEEDNIIPPDFFVKINQYMQKGNVPIVSGLYWTKSNPTEPIIYRGRGNGAFIDFKMGDKIWCDGFGFGATLIHGSLIQALWDESEEYEVNGQVTRKVFSLPDKKWGDPSKGEFGAVRGTTDLQFYTRLQEDGIYEKAGWKKYQKKKYPLLMDTSIEIGHIDQQGRIYKAPQSFYKK